MRHTFLLSAIQVSLEWVSVCKFARKTMAYPPSSLKTIGNPLTHCFWKINLERSGTVSIELKQGEGWSNYITVALHLCLQVHFIAWRGVVNRKTYISLEFDPSGLEVGKRMQIRSENNGLPT